MPSDIRINKFICQNTQYSRRKADQLILEGKIKLNGKTVQDLGTKINPQTDSVTIQNLPVKIQEQKHYFILNKPVGFICTRSDELGRKTILDLLPPHINNLKPVGRLDKDSEGLILISNDGDFIYRYTHPKFNCEKEYIVIISGQLSSEHKNLLEKGILIEDKKTAPAQITLLENSKTSTKLKIIIKEGRNRQIRKMFQKIGHTVKHLQRVRIGKIMLKNLALGQYAKLNPQQINDL